MKISVCMAVYNGSQYICEQVASILPQLGEDDEVVVVDDASQDASVAILEAFHDDGIRIIRQPNNCGVVRTFERVIGEATGEIIFLSDQDDVWHPNKIATMMRAFAADPRVTLVLSNGELIDSNGMPLSQQLKGGGRFSPGVLPNLIKNQYQGSTMAFRREVLEAALLFPNDIPMHDSWIGLVNAVIGRTVYLPDRLVFYRRHESNVKVGRHGRVERMFAQPCSLALFLCGAISGSLFDSAVRGNKFAAFALCYVGLAVIFSPFQNSFILLFRYAYVALFGIAYFVVVPRLPRIALFRIGQYVQDSCQ